MNEVDEFLNVKLQENAAVIEKLRKEGHNYAVPPDRCAEWFFLAMQQHPKFDERRMEVLKEINGRS